MRYPDGKVLPDRNKFKTKDIELGAIGSPCFAYHSKWKSKATWDAYKCGDFRLVKKLERFVEESFCVWKYD